MDSPTAGSRHDDEAPARAGMRALAAALLFALVLVLGACGGSDDEGGGGGGGGAASGADGLPAEYTIGANIALTGAIAPYDKPALDGFRMAVEEINAKGGIGGKSKINLVIENDRSDAAESAKVTQGFVSQDVDFMVAPGDSSVAIPAARIAQQAEIPIMSILASTTTIRQAVGDYFFSNAASDSLVAAGLARYAMDEGIDTAYTLIGPDSAFTQKLPEYFATAFTDAGGKIVGSDEYRSGTQDFGPQIAAIRNAKPQPKAIMTSMYEPEFPAFLKQLRAAGVDLPLLESDAIDTPATLELGELIDGTIAVTYGFPTPGDSLDDYYKRFEEKYGEAPPAVFPAIGYDAAYIIADAVERAGTADPAAVRDAIEQTKEFDGVVGVTTFGTSLEGFPIRPVTIQRWNLTKPGEVKRELVKKLSLGPDEIPAP
jgi:branched-chain amino acid transport system substrate-binding protein